MLKMDIAHQAGLGMPWMAVLLLYTGLGAVACVWAARRWFAQIRGVPQKTLKGENIPWPVWPLVIFFGLMCIGAGLPSLLGHPHWLIDRVFSVAASVLN